MATGLRVPGDDGLSRLAQRRGPGSSAPIDALGAWTRAHLSARPAEHVSVVDVLAGEELIEKRTQQMALGVVSGSGHYAPLTATWATGRIGWPGRDEHAVGARSATMACMGMDIYL